MSKLYTHKETSGLYDWNGVDLTKVLKIYEGNIPRFRVFSYQMCKDYRKATKEDIRKFRLTYYNDNGVKCLYRYNLRKSNLIFIDSIGCINGRYKHNSKEFKIIDFDAEKIKYEVIIK